MSRSCCNRRCFYLNIAYSIIFNNVIDGVQEVLHVTFETVFVGLALIVVAILFFVALYKANNKLFFTFLIIEPILLVFYLIKCILDLVSFVRYQNNSELKRVFLILNVVGCLINLLMVGIMVVYYRELVHEKEIKNRESGSVNVVIQERDKKVDSEVASA